MNVIHPRDNPSVRIIVPFDKAFGWTLQDTRTTVLSVLEVRK